MNYDHGKKITPLRAIRAKCIDCMCGSSFEVAQCPSDLCPLYDFRFGKNPNVKLSEEERERRRQLARENLFFTQRVKSTSFVEVGDEE